MKSIIFCFTLLVFFSPGVQGQRLSSPDSSKYRINLPGYWRPGNKIWQILNDKLPLVCEELKDKELCGDNCSPLYTIEFEMSEPVIFNYSPNHISSDYTNNQYKKPSEVWDFATWYGFECSLLLLDEKDKILTRLILVDTNEVWTVTNRVTLASYSPAPRQMMYIRRNNRSGAADINNTANQPVIESVAQEGQTPFAYINNNKDKLSPGRKDMLAVIDNKIRGW